MIEAPKPRTPTLAIVPSLADEDAPANAAPAVVSAQAGQEAPAPANAPKTALVVDQFGAYVGKHSEWNRVTVKRDVVAEAPLLFLEQVLVVGRAITVSSDVIKACCERGIPMYFLSFRGEPYAALYAAGLGGTVLTRRARLAAHGTEKGIALGCAFARGKIASQANLLRYVAKYRKTTDLALHRELRLCAGKVLQTFR